MVSSPPTPWFLGALVVSRLPCRGSRPSGLLSYSFLLALSQGLCPKSGEEAGQDSGHRGGGGVRSSKHQGSTVGGRRGRENGELGGPLIPDPGHPCAGGPRPLPRLSRAPTVPHPGRSEKAPRAGCGPAGPSEAARASLREGRVRALELRDLPKRHLPAGRKSGCQPRSGCCRQGARRWVPSSLWLSKTELL